MIQRQVCPHCNEVKELTVRIREMLMCAVCALKKLKREG